MSPEIEEMVDRTNRIIALASRLTRNLEEHQRGIVKVVAEYDPDVAERIAALSR